MGNRTNASLKTRSAYCICENEISCIIFSMLRFLSQTHKIRLMLSVSKINFCRPCHCSLWLDSKQFFYGRQRVHNFSRSDTHEYEYGLSTTNSTNNSTSLDVTSKSEPAKHEKKAVLMMSTYDSRNIPMVIGFNGKISWCQSLPLFFALNLIWILWYGPYGSFITSSSSILNSGGFLLNMNWENVQETMMTT